MNVLTPVRQAALLVKEANRKHKVLIDEVALLFSNEANLSRFVRLSTEGGLEHFNSVKRDVMRRQDTEQAENFTVRFEFLRVPNAPWRIEAMCVIDGEAPLHELHLARHGNASVVHASWKLPDVDVYTTQLHALKRLEYKFNAEYRNSYGLFSYWGGEDDYYLKPRVNMRDAKPL